MFIKLIKYIIINIYNFFIYLSCRIKSNKSDDNNYDNEENNEVNNDIEKNNLIESESESYNTNSPIIRLRRGSMHCDDIKISQKFQHPVCEIIIRE